MSKFSKLNVNFRQIPSNVKNLENNRRFLTDTVDFRQIPSISKNSGTFSRNFVPGNQGNYTGLVSTIENFRLSVNVERRKSKNVDGRKFSENFTYFPGTKFRENVPEYSVSVENRRLFSKFLTFDGICQKSTVIFEIFDISGIIYRYF